MKYKKSTYIKIYMKYKHKRVIIYGTNVEYFRFRGTGYRACIGR